MKKLKTALTIGLYGLPLLALAQGGVTPTVIPEQVNIPNLLTNIINWLFGLLLLLASVFIIVAAFYYLTSAGDEEKVKKAKGFIIYAVVAIVVAFLARGIVFIVQQLLGLT